jgi:cytochrome c-type biogenesis protein CcmE
MKTESQLKLNFVKLPLVIVLMLFGCEGSNLLAGGGQSGTGITTGTISSFGSINVNGIRFDTAQAQIFVDGEAVGTGDDVARNHLAVGQLVKIQGTINDDNAGSVAERVHYERSLVGPVSSIQYLDPNTLQVTILGQNVIADNNTTWNGIEADGLMLDTIIEVSGHIKDDDTLLATYITIENDAMTLIVKGTIAELNVAEQTFQINGLDVDFSGAAGNTTQLNEGDLVRIEGFLTEDDIFLASELILWDPIGEQDTVSQPAVVAGIVNNFKSVHNFSINYIPVTTDDETVFVGITADQLTNGVSVVVTGTLSDGVLNADVIEVNGQFIVQHGTVQSIDLVNGTITLAEAATALIQVSGATEFTGEVNTFEALSLEDNVMVSGWRRPDGSISALELFVFPQFPSPSQPVVVAGIVNSFESAHNFFINHIPVTTDDQTVFTGITADQLTNGVSIVVTGTLSDGVLNADSIELLITDPNEVNEQFIVQHGTVQSIDLANGIITLAEATTTLIRVSADTEFNGRVNTFEALSLEDNVMVSGWRRPDGSIGALELFVFPQFPSPF